MLFAWLGAFAPLNARAGMVGAVPPGATAVTVLVCDRADGCAAETRAMAEHCEDLGVPLLDFEAVAAAGPAGGTARERYAGALAVAEGGGPLDDAFAALRDLPFTTPPDEPFRLWLLRGARDLSTGDEAGAERSFAAAASGSGGRVIDLPPLGEAAQARYLDAVDRMGAESGQLRVTTDGPDAAVYVDGREVGAAPLTIAVAPGWHRVSAERTGRRTAWVGEVVVPSGRLLEVEAEVGADDGTESLRAALVGATRGVAPPAGVTEAFSTWAISNGLDYVRFVTLARPEHLGSAAPEERFRADDGEWAVRAAWLDLAGGRFAAHGPGPAALQKGADTERFRLGAGLGYLHLAARDHVSIEAAGTLLLAELEEGADPWGLSLDLHLGILRSGEVYYLYDNWVDRQVYPVAAGLRVGRSSGPYAGARALAVVPFALGGLASAGWDLAPARRWRVGAEARGGATDKGWLAGGSIVLTRRS